VRPTVREACRQRMPLDGADAQALEGALTQVEREKAALEARNRKLVDRLLRIADDIAVAGINGFGNAIRAAIEENDDGK